MGKGFLRSWLSIIATIALLGALAPATAAQSAEGSEPCESVPGDDWCEQWVRTFDGGRGSDSELSQPYAVLSPDGKQLFVTGYDDQPGPAVDLVTAGFDTATGNNLWVARYPAGAVSSREANIAVSRDGTRVFVTGIRHDPQVCQQTNAACTQMVTVAYNAAPPQAASDPALGEQLWVATQDPAIIAHKPGGVAVTPDGSTVVVAGTDRGLAVTVAYDAATGEQRWLTPIGKPTAETTAIVISPDGRYAYVTGTADRSDTADAVACAVQQPHLGPCLSALTIAYAVSGESAGEEQWVAEYNGHQGTAMGWHVAVSDDGERVFMAAYSQPKTNADFRIATVAYDASSGARLWAAGYAGGLGPDNRPPSARQSGPGIAVSPDNDQVYVTGTSKDNALRIPILAYGQAEGDLRWSQTYGAGAAAGKSVAVSPDGALVFVAGGTSGSQVTLAYDSRTGGPVRYARGAPNSTATRVVGSPDGQNVYSVATSWGNGSVWLISTYLSPTSGPDPTPTPTETTTAAPSPSESGSPSPSPSASSAPGLSDVAFTEDSAQSGQYSDETLFKARLADSNGEPIESRELSFDASRACEIAPGWPQRASFEVCSPTGDSETRWHETCHSGSQDSPLHTTTFYVNT